MTFLKSQNYGYSKEISGCQAEWRDEQLEHRGFLDSEDTLYDTIKMDIYHYSFVQIYKTYNTKSEPQGKPRTLGIIMCQYRFIFGNKCSIWRSDINNGEGYACVGAGGLCEIFVSSSRFRCKPKTPLKKSFFKSEEFK